MYAKKSYASGGMTDPKKRTMSIHEQGIVDQGDGFIVYETPGGERLRVSVPDNFKLTPNKTYTAVMGQGGFKLEMNTPSILGPKDPPGQRGDMFKGGGYMKFMDGGLESMLKRRKKNQGSNMESVSGPSERGRAVAGQETSAMLQDENGDYYVYDLEGVSRFMEDGKYLNYDAPKEVLDGFASSRGLDRLYLPKFNDGQPKTSRLDGYGDGKHLDDDTFEVIEIGGRKVLMPYTEVDPAYRANTDRQSPATPGYRNISEEEARRRAAIQGSRGRGMNNPPPRQ